MIRFGSLENYVDWDAGTCDFDSDNFKELLQFANQFSLYLNIENDYSAKTVLQKAESSCICFLLAMFMNNRRMNYNSILSL